MATPANPDLVKVTEIFLIPSSFLVAAIGTADSNPHRAMLSLLGLVVSLFWLVCVHEALTEHAAGEKLSRRFRLLAALSIVFTIGWAISSVIHCMLWSKPLGQ